METCGCAGLRAARKGGKAARSGGLTGCAKRWTRHLICNPLRRRGRSRFGFASDFGSWQPRLRSSFQKTGSGKIQSLLASAATRKISPAQAAALVAVPQQRNQRSFLESEQATPRSHRSMNGAAEFISPRLRLVQAIKPVHGRGRVGHSVLAAGHDGFVGDTGPSDRIQGRGSFQFVTARRG